MLGLFILSFIPSVLAAPLTARGLGITFGPDASGLPTLTLPYATYRAASYDVSDDYYKFKNIRFAAPPVGNLRWSKPAPPQKEEGVQDGKVGYQCFQATPKQFKIAYPIVDSLEPSSEDCLFLDIMVPGKAVRGEVKDLPVMVWIFGGGYALGSKSFFLYDGSPYMKASNNGLIYVAGNYRVGAFGFLNGPRLESQATPNVGLYDQRAVFQWVQDHIGLLGGNKNSVTAMGESAGAGSIMHHLVAEGGTLNPLFNRAIMMSPAFEPSYNIERLNKQYDTFEKAAGCDGKGIDCLRNSSTDALKKANLETILASPYGTFGYGPTVDGNLIKDLPGVELANGNYWKDVSIFLGHTAHEGLIFADPSLATNAQVKDLVKQNFPRASDSTMGQLMNLYPEPDLFGTFHSNYERLTQLIGDWVVNCNTRFLAKAYAGKVWTYQFSVPPGIHGLDLIFAFFRADLDLGGLQIDIDIPFITQNNLATGFQSYLTSFIRTGNPNTSRQKWTLPPTRDFPMTSVGQNMNVLDVNILGYSVVQDRNTPKDRCDFWQAGAWTGRN